MSILKEEHLLFKTSFSFVFCKGHAWAFVHAQIFKSLKRKFLTQKHNSGFSAKLEGNLGLLELAVTLRLSSVELGDFPDSRLGSSPNILSPHSTHMTSGT